METTRGCARLSPELISRCLASSVRSTDQTRLWWNIKCCLVSHWQQRCHMHTQEKSIRLWSVSQVLPVIRFEHSVFVALNPNHFLFMAGFVLVQVRVQCFLILDCHNLWARVYDMWMRCALSRYKDLQSLHPISTHIYQTQIQAHICLFHFTFSLFQFSNYSSMSVFQHQPKTFVCMALLHVFSVEYMR